MDLPVNNQVICGNCISVMKGMPEKSADLIFADPPYNLQLEQDLWRPDQTRVDAVDDAWDRFDDMAAYDAFTEEWLTECRRVLKDTGTIWVIGSYHNIYRVGRIMADLGYWFLNDIVWIKANPMPNFRGARFTNAHETLIWARKAKDQKKYTFNYQAMKSLNGGKQMRSDWLIPICTGRERCLIDGRKAHSTQKPEALLYRIIMASSSPGDTVLDPFFGSGTTGAVARRLGRNWIGIEQDEGYVAVARKRIAAIPLPQLSDEMLITPTRTGKPRVAFGTLLDNGYFSPGQKLYSAGAEYEAIINADASLSANGFRGSIHQTGALVQGLHACNGWDFWHCRDIASGRLFPIDEVRRRYREVMEEAGPIPDF